MAVGQVKASGWVCAHRVGVVGGVRNNLFGNSLSGDEVGTSPSQSQLPSHWAISQVDPYLLFFFVMHQSIPPVSGGPGFDVVAHRAA